jgi:hypothetical protein
MEPSPLEAKTSREGVKLLSGIPDQVRPLAAPPTDATVVYVHGHPFLSVPEAGVLPGMEAIAMLTVWLLARGDTDWPDQRSAERLLDRS